MDIGIWASFMSSCPMRIKISGNGVYLYIGAGVRFADFIYFSFLFFILIGYLNGGGGVGFSEHPESPLDSPLVAS